MVKRKLKPNSQHLKRCMMNKSNNSPALNQKKSFYTFFSPQKIIETNHD